MEHRDYAPCHQRQQNQLTKQSHAHGFGIAEDHTEVTETQRQSQVEHQQRQDRKNDKNAIHIIWTKRLYEPLKVLCMLNA